MTFEGQGHTELFSVNLALYLRLKQRYHRSEAARSFTPVEFPIGSRPSAGVLGPGPSSTSRSSCSGVQQSPQTPLSICESIMSFTPSQRGGCPDAELNTRPALPSSRVQFNAARGRLACCDYALGRYGADAICMAHVERRRNNPIILSLPSHHELASISAHIFFICSLFFFASSRFCAVRSNRSARKHLLTSRFVSLHIPIAFHIKPLAWHSSRAVMISSHPIAPSQCRCNDLV